MAKRDRHTEVWDALASLGGVKCWMTAGDGRNLLRQRNEADYGERIGGLLEEAKKALKMADQIIREVGGINQG